MFDGNLIRESFVGMVGVRSKATLPTIPISLRSSSSGYYLGPELDSLLTLESIFESSNSMLNYESLENSVPVFSSSVPYEAGELVHFEGADLVARRDLGAGSDPTDPGDWEETSVFGEYLRDKMQGASLDAVRGVLAANGLDAYGRKSLLTNITLYSGLGAVRETIQKSGRFVGIRVEIKHTNTIFKIHRIATQFSQAQQGIPVYLYKDGVSQPVRVWSVNQSNGGDMETHAIEEFSETSGMSMGFGVFKVGYFEDDLEGMAIHRKVNFSPGCSSCDPRNYAIMKSYSPYVRVVPFFVNASDLNGTSQWDSGDEDYGVRESNFGLNMWLSLSCDLTEVIVSHREAFSDAYLAALKLSFIREVSMSYRGNHIVNSTKSLLQQIGGDAKVYKQDKGPKILVDDYEGAYNQAIASTMLDISGADSVCLPKTKKENRIRILS